MELKDKLVSSFMAFENRVDVNHAVHDIRTQAMKVFEQKGFPTKKDEAWKYTSLNALLNNDYSVFPKQESATEFKDIKKYFIHDIDSYRIVFIDGVFSSHLSQVSHEGLDVCTMGSALTKPKYQLLIDHYFNKTVDEQDSLTALNTAFSKEGAFINVPKGKLVEKPIQILYFSTGKEAAQMLQPRNLVIVGENAYVQIIERHQSLTSN